MNERESADIGVSPAQAFRLHRHDVLNGLQIAKAYIQLNRPDKAGAAIDTLAAWLTSLSLWQSRLAGTHETLLWAAAQSSRVSLTDAPRLNDLTEPDIVNALANTLLWLDAQMSEYGLPRVYIAIVKMQSGESAESVWTLYLLETEEIRAWWGTIQALDNKPWTGSRLEICLGEPGTGDDGTQEV